LPEVKKSFIGSGVRYDILMNDNATPEEARSHKLYTEELIAHHVSGRLKVAPEHTSKAVLDIMRKPSFELFYKFKKEFDEINCKYKLNQQIIPYFISSHPGCHDVDMAELAAETSALDFKLEQVQDFTPTPMTVSTTIYYTGVHPYTLKPVYTAHTPDEKKRQRMFFFWYKPEERQRIQMALRAMNRRDIEERLCSQKINNYESSKPKQEFRQPEKPKPQKDFGAKKSYGNSNYGKHEKRRKW
jgi:radical SAM superfamily enzyme YgiQ (UPF0313 family)